MKKHKNIAAILLAVMMIFTMMPSMVFATGQQSATSWAEKVATMTDKDGDTFNTTRTFDEGLIEAVGQNNKTVVPETVAPSDGIFFTDFDSSMLTFNNGVKLDGTTWKQAQFGTHSLELTLTQPDYTEGYDAKNPQKVILGLTKVKTDETTGVTEWSRVVNGWTVRVEESQYEAGLEADQTVTFMVSVAPVSEVKGTEAAPDAFGKPANATVTVKGENKVPETAKIYLDAVGGVECTGTGLAGGTLTGLYDGDTHTVVTDMFPGYTASYEIYNPQTGEWAVAPSVSIADVQENPIRFRVVYYTNDNVPTRTNDIILNLTAAKGALVGFKLLNAEDGWTYRVEGREYKATDYISVEPMNSMPYSIDDTLRAEAQAKDAACAKAVAKNEAEIMNYFNELYDVIESVSKDNPDLVNLSIVPKDLTVNEKNVIAMKYRVLTRNFGLVEPGKGLAYSEINDEAQIILKGKESHDHGSETPAPGGGGGDADVDAVQQVVDQINALNEPYDVAKVKAAREAYDKLTDEQKKDLKFTDEIMKKLSEAETAVESAQAVGKVSDLIRAIPNDFAKATSDQVSAAVEAYHSLTDAQKKLLTVYDFEKLQSALNYPAQVQKVALKSVTMKKGKQVVVKWKENAVANGYQIYIKAKGEKAKKISINSGATVRKTAKKLKAGKNYTIKIRPYVEIENLATGKPAKVYGRWSKVKKATAKK